MHWQDFRFPAASGPWQGLDMHVERSDLSRGAPVLRVHTSKYLIDMTCERDPILWAHVHPHYAGLWLLMGQRRESLSVVPPIASRTISKIEAAPFEEAWWRAWARWFARELVASPHTPLFPGRWGLSPARAAGTRSPPMPSPPPTAWVNEVHDVSTCLDAPALCWEGWAGSGRDGSRALVRARWVAPGSARSRGYRKRVRDGTLPPVLVQWVSGLDMFVLLDGHDRLRAALLEGRTPAFMVLWRVQVVPNSPSLVRQAGILRELERREKRGARLDVDALNRLLVDAFDNRDWLYPTTPAWPIEGGPARWEQQVLAAGVAPAHPIFSGEWPPPDVVLTPPA